MTHNDRWVSEWIKDTLNRTEHGEDEIDRATLIRLLELLDESYEHDPETCPECAREAYYDGY